MSSDSQKPFLAHPGAFQFLDPKVSIKPMSSDNQAVKKPGPYFCGNLSDVPDRVDRESPELADAIRALRPKQNYKFEDAGRDHLTTLAQMRSKYSLDDDDLHEWLTSLYFNTFHAWAKNQGGAWAKKFGEAKVSKHRVKATAKFHKDYLQSIVDELKEATTPPAPVIWAAVDRAAFSAAAPREPWFKAVMGNLLNNKKRGMMASPWTSSKHEPVVREHKAPFTTYTKLLLDISTKASTLADVQSMVTAHQPIVREAHRVAAQWLQDIQKHETSKVMNGECVAGPKPLKEERE